MQSTIIHSEKDIKAAIARISIGDVMHASSYSGSFLTVPRGNSARGYVISCREVLHRSYPKLPTLALKLGRKQSAQSFALFISILESCLNIPQKARSIVTWVGGNLVAVQSGAWWLKNKYRQQFFTIALRSALSFTDENAAKYKKTGKISRKALLEHLATQTYFKHTLPAVVRFLQGETLTPQGFFRYNQAYDIAPGWYQFNRKR